MTAAARTAPRSFEAVATVARFELGDPATPAAPGADPIVLEVPLAIPWGIEVQANGFGDTVTFEPGSLEVTDAARVKFLLDHRPEKPFGYGTAFHDTGAGLAATIAIPRAERADLEVAGAVRQMGNGVRDAVSVGVNFTDTTDTVRDDGTYATTVHAGRLVELSTVTIPRFEDARHQPLQAAHERLDMTATATLTPPDPSPPDPTDPPDPDDAVRMAAHRATMQAIGALVVRAEPHPLARFGSFTEYSQARRADLTIPDLRAVWIDQITTNNPGVLPPAWLTEIFGIVDNGRPFVQALGGGADPGASGMDVAWPYYAGDLASLVKEQMAQKTEVTSVRVDILKGTTPLRTFAGGSDIAYQLLLRSSPSYLAAYEQIMAAAYALTTETAALTGAVAGSPGGIVIDFSTATTQEIAAVLFEASLRVQRATGSPANVVAAGDAAYVAIAAAVFAFGSSPAANVAGAAASASGLTVALAGFTIVSAPALATDTALVTNRQAGRWFEDGPRTVTAEDVHKLGLDVAVWGMGAWGTMVANGIVELGPSVTPFPPPALAADQAAERSSSSARGK